MLSYIDKRFQPQYIIIDICTHTFVAPCCVQLRMMAKPHLLSEHPLHNYQLTSQQYQHDLP